MGVYIRMLARRFDSTHAYAFDTKQICTEWLTADGSCSPAVREDALDCRGCRIRQSLYDGKCSHLCQYPERCSHWFSSDFQCVPNFIYGFIIADCNGCKWHADDFGFSVV